VALLLEDRLVLIVGYFVEFFLRLGRPGFSGDDDAVHPRAVAGAIPGVDDTDHPLVARC
jgi:hypothetical protein